VQKHCAFSNRLHQVWQWLLQLQNFHLNKLKKKALLSTGLSLNALS
jgi:hypothetical protein